VYEANDVAISPGHPLKYVIKLAGPKGKA
jgi:hypothetical protein